MLPLLGGYMYRMFTDAVGGPRPRGQESGRAGGVPNHEPLLGADALRHHQKHHHQGDPGPGV